MNFDWNAYCESKKCKDISHYARFHLALKSFICQTNSSCVPCHHVRTRNGIGFSNMLRCVKLCCAARMGQDENRSGNSVCTTQRLDGQSNRLFHTNCLFGLFRTDARKHSALTCVCVISSSVDLSRVYQTPATSVLAKKLLLNDVHTRVHSLHRDPLICIREVS